MSDDVRSVTDPEKPRIPILAWSVMAVVVIALAGGIVATTRSHHDIQVAVTKRALPAYHRIGDKDLEVASVSSGRLPEGGALGAANLLGRVTREAIAEGEPIGADSVTSKVSRSAFAGVTVELKPARSSAIGVKPGDQVELRLAPTAADAALHGVTVPALLLNAGKDGARPFTVVVPPDQADLDRLLNLAGRSDLFITPRP